MNPLEAAALSKMTGYTYEPVEQPPLKPLEAGWREFPPRRINYWEDQRDRDQRFND